MPCFARTWTLAALAAFAAAPGAPGQEAKARDGRPLLARLADAHWGVQRQAQEEFHALPLADRQAHLPGLLALLGEVERGWRVVGPVGWCEQAALPGLAALLASPEPWVRHHALSAVASMGPPARAAALPLLLRGLNDPDPRVRAAAASGLSVAGPAAAGVLPAILAALDRADRERRLAPPEDHDAALYLGSVCLTLVRTLGALGPAAGPAAPTLVALLARPPHRPDDGESLRRDAVAALAAIAPPAATVLPTLVAQLAEPCCAAAAVAALAAQGDQAVPALAQALAGGSEWSRAKAAEALDRIATPAARTALAGTAGSRPEEGTRWATRRETVAPLPPTASNPWPLDGVLELPVPLPEGGRSLVTVHRRDDRRRPDVVTIWRLEPFGWRRILRLEQDAYRATYRATAFVLGGREILHLVRERPNYGAPWRLDLFWRVEPDASLSPLALQRPAAGCGAWLPELGVEETLGAAFEFSGAELRFGFAPPQPPGEQGPPALHWRGTLAVTNSPEGEPQLAVAGCAGSLVLSPSPADPAPGSGPTARSGGRR